MIICTAFANGKHHDFRLFKESKVRALERVQIDTDTGYLGICKIHANSVLPKKKTKKNPLSAVRALERVQIDTDTGYLGICKIHANSVLPKKKTKKNPLSAEAKAFTRKISSERVLNEHVIGLVKRFKIVSDRYRNRRKRFGLRFNLIAGICNFELLC